MEETGFGKIRSFLWPIHRHELSRFVPMLLLFFLISFNYHILKILKDAFIVTAPNSGAEAIPFLKVWAILPSAIILTFLFTKLSTKFNRENIFYVIISVFLVFFALFTFYLHPNAQNISLHGLADRLTTILPSGFEGLIAPIRYWHFSLFYIMAEAWSTIMLSLLLWVFIVDVLSISQAKRYYAFFGTFRNMAGIVAGMLVEFLSHKALNTQLPNTFFKNLGCQSCSDQTLIIEMGLVLLSGIIIIALYKYLHAFIYPERYLLGGSIEKKGKQKISFMESLRFTFKTKYIFYIAVIVLAYNIITNLNETLWKAQLKEMFPLKDAYAAYTSKITYLIGIFASISSFFLSGNLIRRFGWKITALVTPISLIFSGMGFFYFIFLKKYALSSGIAITVFGMTPLALSVYFGSLLEICSRTFKYTIFDDTKEMAFIPLSPEDKLKGKSSIDGIGSRLGKSGGSLLIQILVMIFGSAMGASPFIFVITALMFPMWINSIGKLSKRFEEKQGEKTEITANQ